MMANALVIIGLIITISYCLTKRPSLNDRLFHTSVNDFPMFFGVAMYAMQVIEVILPLENKMKNPKDMSGAWGVLNIGMVIATFLYVLVGSFGYSMYGDDIKGSITLNLPIQEPAAQMVKIIIAIAVYFTAALQFYVLQEIVWNEIEDKITKNRTIANYILRTVLVTASVLLAVAIPTIGPFVELIGALCISVTGLLVPVFIDFLTRWEEGFGKYNWIIWKNIMICILAVFAFIFGTNDAINSIVDHYIKNSMSIK